LPDCLKSARTDLMRHHLLNDCLKTSRTRPDSATTWLIFGSATSMRFVCRVALAAREARCTRGVPPPVMAEVPADCSQVLRCCCVSLWQHRRALHPR
jgi:hypothetical protein